MSNEKKITEEQNTEEKGFWTKNIISILLIIFLIISGVYAFNRDTENKDKTVEEKVEDIKQEENQNTEQAGEEKKDAETSENDKDDAKKEDMSTDIQKNETQFTLKASSGDGVTHLARRAIAEYSKDKNINLSKEQKLYAETVLKNQNYKHHLNPGQEIQFDVNSISDIVQKAQNLSENEIKAWSKYTHLVTSL